MVVMEKRISLFLLWLQSYRIFERVDVQRHPQATRNMVFRIFENLLERHATGK